MEQMLQVTATGYEFDEEDWTREATCWQFAVGDNSECSRLVGDILGKRVTASKIRKFGTCLLREVIQEELDYYGYFSEETEDAFDLPDEAAFKIAVLVSSDGKYHMMKMFPDGSWWRKWAGVQPTNIGPVTGRKISNPLNECFEDCYEIFFYDVYQEEW